MAPAYHGRRCIGCELGYPRLRPRAPAWAIYSEAVLVVDAVILMGGRATRLGGAAKGDLRVKGRTLLERVVAAAEVAHDANLGRQHGRARLADDDAIARDLGRGHDPLEQRASVDPRSPFAAPPRRVARPPIRITASTTSTASL